MISIDGIMIAKCVPAKIIYTFMPFQPSCQREYAFRRTGFGDDGHIGKDAGSPSEEPGKPQSDCQARVQGSSAKSGILIVSARKKRDASHRGPVLLGKRSFLRDCR